jgi:hypothetical protein
LVDGGPAFSFSDLLAMDRTEEPNQRCSQCKNETKHTLVSTMNVANTEQLIINLKRLEGFSRIPVDMPHFLSASDDLTPLVTPGEDDYFQLTGIGFYHGAHHTVAFIEGDTIIEFNDAVLKKTTWQKVTVSLHSYVLQVYPC